MTTEEIAKAFALHIGAEVRYTFMGLPEGGITSGVQFGTHKEAQNVIFVNKGQNPMGVNFSCDPKIVLHSLDSITDAHVMAVCVLFVPQPIFGLKIDRTDPKGLVAYCQLVENEERYEKVFISYSGMVNWGIMNAEIADMLRSFQYDCGYRNIRSLIKHGVALRSHMPSLITEVKAQ